jgi:hypothetical protein
MTRDDAVGPEISTKGCDLRYYGTIIVAGPAGLTVVLGSFLYKLTSRLAQFLMLRPRSDIDNDVVRNRVRGGLDRGGRATS